MKILIYSANFAPEPTGIGKYSGEMAAWLVAQGHEVRVVAAPPYYPKWKIDVDYKWRWYRRETYLGARVWRAPLWIPKKPGGMTRMLHLISFAIMSMPVMFRQLLWRPDVVMTVAPAFVCAPIGWLTARLAGANAWLHIQDFEVDVALRMGLIKGRMLRALALKIERTILRRFDVVSSISRKMVNLLIEKGVAPERSCHYPNWVDVSHIQPLGEVSAYREELGIDPETVVVLFSGSLGKKQDLMLIPEAARVLQHRTKLMFVICGDGVMQPALERAAQFLPNLKLLPLQPFARLGELLGLADIHLLTQSADAEDLVLPSKLSGMLASGRPVIATCNPATEIAGIVEQCGLRVTPGDAVGLAQAVVTLADAPALRQEHGLQARRYAQQLFAQQAVLERMLARLENCTPENLPSTP